MKLCKAKECLETLENIFQRMTTDFVFASHLCDLIEELEKQSKKYSALYLKYVEEYYEIDNKDVKKASIKDINKLEEANKKLQELESLEFIFNNGDKFNATCPRNITPKELYYLRQFFDFVF